MRRAVQDARPDAAALVEAEGLAYAREYAPDGAEVPYWHEGAAYVFSEAQVDRLERVTDELHTMAMRATRAIAHDPPTLSKLGIPRWAWRPIREALDADAPTLYGRFDLAWDGESEPKLLEYNADTPAGLVECAVTQWSWLEAMKPDRDQWNMVHERLVQTLRRLVPPGDVLHLAAGRKEPVEDWNTVAYVADAATEAGARPVVLPVEDIGVSHAGGTAAPSTFSRFVDLEGVQIRRAFVMYPWDWMLQESFGRLAVSSDVTWLEPVFKVLTGSKALLEMLWRIYPDHPNLLATAFDRASLTRVTGTADCVAKPVFGWEGAGVTVIRGGEAVEQTAPRHTDGQPLVYQAYHEIVPMDGNLPVLGTWVIGGRAAGLGIRETDAGHLVTDARARFVPHYIDGPRSTPEQIAAWLEE